MTSLPDKRFRDGLEHYRKPAPASAWERIEANMDRKRNRSPWLKIAAGLLLLSGTSLLLLQRDHTDPAIANVSNESSAITLETDTTTSVVEGESMVNDRETSVVNRETLIVSREAPAGQKAGVGRDRPAVGSHETSVVRRETSDGRQVLATVLKETTIASIAGHGEKIAEPMPASQVEEVNENAASDIVQNQKGTNMMYTAEEVNQKFLKKEPVADATPEKKNTSGLQKVIDRALDLRYEESVIADLREKKNEWLSLNIPSKQRETNK